MFTFAVLSCLIVKAIDGSVVREQENPLNGLIQNLELTEDTDIAMMLEGSYPRLGRETTQTPGSDETARHNSLYMSFGRAALVFTEEPMKVKVIVETRDGIRVGRCPRGYIKSGTFCFEDRDY